MSVFALTRDVVVNIFVLYGLVSLYALVHGWRGEQRRFLRPWQTGVVFGVMAVVAMLAPVMTTPGTFFDCRSGIIGAAALLGGPVTAAASLPLPIAYRLYAGGGGTVPGLLELALPALFGSLYHLWLRKRGDALTHRRALVASAVVGSAANAIILLIVVATMPRQLTHLGPTSAVLLLLTAPVSMALMSSLLLLEQQHAAAVKGLADGERRVVHSQKMAAVGQLARKITHSFANALTSLLGHAQLAKDSVNSESPVKKLMDEIIATVGRMSRLTGELLAFSSPGSLRVQRMDPTTCMRGIRRILTESIGSETHLVVESDTKVGKVSMDPDRIEQAVVHLAVNASEAMSGAGHLTISVSSVTPSEEEQQRLQAAVPAHDRHKGAFAVISVKDTGCGMSPDVVAHIFEPFFSTKDRRDNAGLGLATVYHIVHQHDGFVDVHSKPGRGTTVLIYLPIVEELRHPGSAVNTPAD